MPLALRFLPLRRPALHSAAEYLLRRSPEELARTIVAVPAARAARRLPELLAWFHEQSGADRPLTLPRIATAGALPELLMRPAALPVATAGEALAARAAALRGMGADALRRVYPTLPELGDTSGWLRLARELELLDEEIAGERVGYADVADWCAAYAPPGEPERWRALALVDAAARQRLGAVGKLHRNLARQGALEDASGDGLRRGLSVVLIGAIDLPRLAADLVRAVAGYGSNCVSLVYAAESDADGFDDVGRLMPNYWPARVPAVETSRYRIVGTPREQGYAAAEASRRFAEAGLPPEQVTVAIGAGSAALGPVLQRALAAAGFPVRREIAGRLGQTGPVTLLQALAEFAGGGRSAAAWASLVRHPDLAAYLGRVWNSPADAARLPARSDALRLLSLPATAADPAPKPLLQTHDRGSLQTKAVATILALLDATQPGPAAMLLADWSGRVTALLAEAYEGREFPADAPEAQALDALGRRLRELADLPASLGQEIGAATLPQAMRWVAGQVAAEPLFAPDGGGGSGQAAGAEDAIAITGWLDALLDDAPALIVAGFNEGSIPETLPADLGGLLPEALRAALGLPSNRRRLNRDAYTLAALIASRDVYLIAARRTAAGEPLAPSRLLFTGADPAQVAELALRFYAPERREPPPAAPALPFGGGDTLACLPRPVAPDPPLERLPATAFRDYLACPYRFYLKHVLKLAVVDDARVEIEGDLFGTLAHDALGRFGRWIVDEHAGRSPAAGEMRTFLGDALDSAARARLAPAALPVAAVQLQRLRRRLHAFADFQARLAGDGWEIVYAEQPLEHALIVDERPFTAHGRVDRIDYHPESGRVRVIDYKTADTAKTPRETHCPRGEWIDLQLPLYRFLAAGLDDAFTPGVVECGYINLPRKLADCRYQPAEWSAKGIAPPDPDQLIEGIVRALRAGVFWPPSDTLPAHDDGLSAICLDSVVGRAELIRRDAGRPAVWDRVKK